MRKKVILVTLISFILDRISKTIVINSLTLYQPNEIINNFFSFTYVQNKGAAWGILTGNVGLLIVITLLALFLMVKFIFTDDNIKTVDAITYGLLLGGICGNFFDRIVYGYVIDFLDFKILGYDYPVFNIADVLIVVSVVIMTVLYIRGDKDENNG